MRYIDDVKRQFTILPSSLCNSEEQPNQFLIMVRIINSSLTGSGKMSRKILRCYTGM